MTPHEAYAELLKLSREETLLSTSLDLLEWDEEVKMPRGGVTNRAEQVALLAGIIHDRTTRERYDELLSAVEDSPVVSDSESVAAVNVREIRRGYDRERKMPRRLVEEGARVRTLASQSWDEARNDDDFKSFAPWLDRVFAIAREEADALGFSETRYDAHLDEYEPGMTTAQLTKLFHELEPKLAALVDSLCNGSSTPSADLLTREFPRELQKAFAEKVAVDLGFDLESGRFDTAKHPFCTAIAPGDVRIGLKYKRRNFARGFFAMVHEVGHALYDQGLDATHYGTPMGEAISLGMHESQSRLWENQVGRSEGFWRNFYPQLQSAFHDSLHDISLETFRRAINRVSRTLIRTQADEVTYNLHILIRFELEQAMLSDGLRAVDVPATWAELYRKRLGIVPRNDGDGCLQDSHWSEGLIGYFPTYTLGNIYAAQLFDAAQRDIGSLDEAFARGDFRSLRDWLTTNVYRHGQRYSSADLIERVTGKAPSASALVENLKSRYQKL